ncbi:MAG TPA: HAD-IIB family hydrolase [Gammaproteobacteria bacterium]|nr:HAD-IIB family hydrolase [Gammaproteobacteria bacterium]
MPRLLLCCDLDRTLLPNGPQPESPAARPLLRRLAAHPALTLAYVSGRDLDRLQAAIEEYALPVPDFAVGDVGTTIYAVKGGVWQSWEAWQREIITDWRGRDGQSLAKLFEDLTQLRLQEPDRQGRFKLSYYTAPDFPRGDALAEMERRLDRAGLNASLIWSLDEVAGCGLLDVLPAGATKLHAIRFLMQQLAFDEDAVVFAGDSGNDLPVLTSGLRSVLVANARPEVRETAEAALRAQGLEDRLYVASGGFLGMNGNYSAGVLEGLAWFFPAVGRWLTEKPRH